MKKTKCDAWITLGDYWEGNAQSFHCELGAGHKGKHKARDEQYGETGPRGARLPYIERWEIKWQRESRGVDSHA